MANIEYYGPQDAYELACEALRDNKLQEKVNTYLGGVWPPGFEQPDVPRALFSPYLQKGSKLELEFLKVARSTGFTTVVASYENIPYMNTNSGLVDTYRPPLELPNGQRARSWVVPESERTGALADAMTRYAELDIRSYWRGIRTVVLEEACLPTEDTQVDFSDWYALQAKRFGWESGAQKARFYYKAIMALCASGRATLFDLPDEEFDKRIIEPAIDDIQRAIGTFPVKKSIEGAVLLTNVLTPEKRDWVDLEFLDQSEAESLLQNGRIQ